MTQQTLHMLWIKELASVENSFLPLADAYEALPERMCSSNVQVS
jgi:hypothetical protein